MSETRIPSIGRRRSLRALVAFLVGIVALPGPLAAPARAHTKAEPAAGCRAATLPEAAISLFGPGTEVGSRQVVADLKTALVLEPRIYPGTRHRLIKAGDQWCDATTGFNSAWHLLGRPVEGAAMAQAYVQLAAAPYFDDVTVLDVAPSLPGVYQVDTHARTNGVRARWVVKTDDQGIALARWEATGFAMRPFVAEWEGLTALPGAQETYDRISHGLLWPRRGLPTGEELTGKDGTGDQGPGLTYRGPDGFNVVISYGDTRFAPDIGQDTGVDQVDVIRATYRTVKENYEDFLGWGLEKGWVPAPGGPPDEGYVYINDALSLYCIACVLIADDFQIHITSAVVETLELLGYAYPDRAKALSTVIGHEMFHNFQNAYVKPGFIHNRSGRSTTVAYSEGTARAQETMHAYSDVSHQHQSLVYAKDSNGCNGFDQPNMDAGMARSPFGTKTYNACYFWLPWYGEEGVQGLVDLVAREIPKTAHLSGSYEQIAPALAAASDDDIVTLLARFAVAAIAGGDYSWGPPTGGAERDWSLLLDRWRPPVMKTGQRVTDVLLSGGMMARELTSTAPVHLDSPTGPAPAGSALFVIRKGADGTSVGFPASGDVIAAPTDGERVWVVAAYAKTGQATLSLRFGDGPSIKPPPPGATEIDRRSHRDRGRIGLGSPVTSWDASTTELEFSETCQWPPESQGQDAYVFAVPEGLDGPGATFTLRGSDASGQADVDARLYSTTCRWLYDYTASGDEVAKKVFPGTAFIVALGYFGKDIDVSLEVETPIYGPSTVSPSASPTPAASESPAASPEPTASPTPTPSPTPIPRPPDECETTTLPDLGADVMDVAFPTADRGWVLQPDGISRSDDAGQSWTPKHTRGRGDLSALAARGADEMWATSYSDELVGTRDGGTKWQHVRYGSYFPYPIDYVQGGGIDFADEDHAWAVGVNRRGLWWTGPGFVVKTTDGGRTWEHMEEGHAWLTEVDFYNRNIGYVGGAFLYRTTDGGNSWTRIPPATFEGYTQAILAVGDQVAFIGTHQGRIYRTTDRGETWATVAQFPGAISALAGSSKRVFAVGDQGLVATSRDGGATWKEINLGGAGLTAVAARTTSKAIVAGRGGRIVEVSCTPPPELTEIAFTEEVVPEAAQYSDPAELQVSLQTAVGSPVPDARVRFELRREDETLATAEARTDGAGFAVATLPLDQAPGTYSLRASFEGDDRHEGSSTSRPLLITREDSSVSISVEGQGANRVASARLSDGDDAQRPVVARVVEFFADGTSIGCGTTNDMGVATVAVPPPFYGPQRAFGSTFNGDDYYLGSTAGSGGERRCAPAGPEPEPEPSVTPTPTPTPTSTEPPPPPPPTTSCDSSSSPPAQSSSWALSKIDQREVRLIKNFPYSNASDIDFSGDYVYAGEHAGAVDTGGVHIIDVSGEEPSKAGFVEWSGYQNDVAVVEPGLIAVAYHWNDCDTGAGVRLVDVSDPAEPRLLGSVNLPDGTHTLTVYPGKRLIYASPGGLGNGFGVEQIIDVSDPLDPKVAATFTPNGLGCHDVAFHVTEEQQLAACAGTDESQLWDVSDPLEPRILSRIVNPLVNFHHSVAFTPDGKHLVVGDEDLGANVCATDPVGALHMYDVSDPSQPVFKSFFSIDRGPAAWLPDEDRYRGYCSAHNYNFVPTTDGSYILVAAWYSAGMNVIDWSVPSAPVEIAHYMTESPSTEYWSAYWYGGRVYATDRSRGLDVFEVDALSPQAIGSEATNRSSKA